MRQNSVKFYEFLAPSLLIERLGPKLANPAMVAFTSS